MASKKDLLARIGKLGAKEFAANEVNLNHTQKELIQIISNMRIRLKDSTFTGYNHRHTNVSNLFLWDSTPQGLTYWRLVFNRVNNESW